jgi:hypothetical protein
MAVADLLRRLHVGVMNKSPALLVTDIEHRSPQPAIKTPFPPKRPSRSQGRSECLLNRITRLLGTTEQRVPQPKKAGIPAAIHLLNLSLRRSPLPAHTYTMHKEQKSFIR